MGLFTVPNTKATAQQFADRVRSDLASNTRFASWRQGASGAIADPHKFGIDYLPKGSWIDKQGNVVTTSTGIPAAAWMLAAAPAAIAAAPAIGGALGVGAAGTTAASVAPTVAPAVAGAGTIGGLAGGSTAAGTFLGLTGRELVGLGMGGANTILGYAANRQQARGADQALAYERENEMRRRQEYDQQNAQMQAQWDAEQTRRAPYREASNALLQAYMQSRGMPLGQRPAPPMPAPTLHPMGGTIGSYLR